MTTAMAIQISDFRPYEKNTLQGFLTVLLSDMGLEIKDIALHRKDGKRWLQLPAKLYRKPDGSQGWSYIVSFNTKKDFKLFQEVTLTKLDTFRQGEARRNATDANQKSQSGHRS